MKPTKPKRTVNYDNEIGWHKTYKGFKYVDIINDGIAFKYPNGRTRWFFFHGSMRKFKSFTTNYLKTEEALK